MIKLEKEIKILDINVDDAIKKLNIIGAELLANTIQKLYTYNIPTIYYRFLECMELLYSNNEITKNVSKNKLKVILDEFSDLVDDDVLKTIYNEMNISDFNDLYKLDTEDLINKFNNSNTFNETIKSKLINPNKWLRLRKNNEKVELTVKHIYDKNDRNIQKVQEYEINTNSFEDTNKLLEAIGISRKSYQEKKRISYKYKTAEIEIDLWPMLNPYMEIECDDEEVMDELLEKLDFKDKEIVSINTSDLYRRINIDIEKVEELKFTDKN